MATEQGIPNKKFDSQMRLHRLAWKPGTKEYLKRKDYPGDAARDHVCSHTNCLNYQWDQPEVETYWLCPECAAVAPCTVTEFFTHAPFKILPPLKKRRAACAAAFAAWAHRKKRLPKPDPGGGPDTISAKKGENLCD